MNLDLTPLLNGWHYQNIINAVLTQQNTTGCYYSVSCWYRILFGLQSTFWQYNNVGLYFFDVLKSLKHNFSCCILYWRDGKWYKE